MLRGTDYLNSSLRGAFEHCRLPTSSPLTSISATRAARSEHPRYTPVRACVLRHSKRATSHCLQSSHRSPHRMALFPALVICLLLAPSISLANQAPPRQGRGIFKPNTYTVFIEQKSLVTEINPSSCVVVEPSLPPCRHVRQLRIQPTTTTR
ncbi:hypothetical protein M8J75_008483 [Diaphorina citri]|nr:hypothetical protein M8J75_008483 [Diaphorina citri]